MRTRQTEFKNSIVIKLHDKHFLEKQRMAGKVVGQTLAMLRNLVEEKTKLSLLEIDQLVGIFLKEHNCLATFKGYKGFPGNLCISVNKQLVHGVPIDYVLQEGDVVKFDLGATFEQAIGDAARTFIYGEPKSEQHLDLIKTTRLCLD